jgi:hypothetical protein
LIAKDDDLWDYGDIVAVGNLVGQTGGGVGDDFYHDSVSFPAM